MSTQIVNLLPTTRLDQSEPQRAREVTEMLPRRGTVTRYFPLNEPVNIPRRLAEYRRGDRSLFVAVTKASFVSTGPIGAEFIYMFEDSIPLGAALSTLCKKYGKAREAEIRTILSDLLTQVEVRGFYQNAQAMEAASDPGVLARLTNRCNLRCRHCIMSSSPDWPTHKELTTTEWCATLEQYAEFVSQKGFVKHLATLSGGEPLLRKDALEIALHSKSLGIRTELFSNAVLITSAKIANEVASAFDEVQVSLDGATAEVHDSVRGPGTFARAVTGLRLLREANGRVCIAVVLMPQNYNDLIANLSALVRQLGEGFVVKLGLAVPHGRATQGMLFSSLEEGEQKIRTLIERMADEEVRFPDLMIPNRKTTSCGYGRSITIDSDGLVYACGPQQFPIGNLKTEPLFSIAERIFQKSKMAEIDLVGGCRDCNLRYLCGGTCRVRNISHMGRAEVTCCDEVEKERKINLFFARALDIPPLHVLSNNSDKGGVRPSFD